MQLLKDNQETYKILNTGFKKIENFKPKYIIFYIGINDARKMANIIYKTG